jgi:hypothetical protein
VERRHFACPHFMQDLPGFGIRLRIVVGRLIGCEPLEHGQCHARVEPQALHSRYEAIAPERRRVPWDSRIGIRPLWGVGHQDGKVRGRTPQNFIEHLIGGFDLGADPDHLLQFAVGVAQALQEWQRRLGRIAIAGDRTVERKGLVRLEIELK